MNTAGGAMGGINDGGGAVVLVEKEGWKCKGQKWEKYWRWRRHDGGEEMKKKKKEGEGEKKV